MPFTVRQFLEVFRAYNLDIWPAQIVAYLAGTGCLVAILIRTRWSGGLALATLAAFWAWNGVAYHWTYFRTINPLATIFGALFVAEALILIWQTARPQSGAATSRVGAVAGWMMIVYAMAIYPMAGQFLGRSYPESPTFGVTPCPTTIFTFGVLTLRAGEVRGIVLAIPILWAAVGTSAALTLGIREDLGLAVAAALAIWVRISQKSMAADTSITRR